MVKYQVQFKPINPINNNPITNTSVFSANDSTTVNTDYDCLLMYTRTSWPTDPTTLGQTRGYIPLACIKQLVYPTWCVYTQVESVKQAMAIAKPLMQEYGLGNVQICKVVPTSTTIVFEEN